MDDGTKRFLRRLAFGVGARVVANLILPGIGESIAHAADKAALGADHIAAGASAGDLHFGAALGEAGRFVSDYVLENGTRLVSDAAGNLFDPNTGAHYGKYDFGVDHNPC